MNRLELLLELIDELDSVEHGDTQGLNVLTRRGEMVIRKLFGESSKYLQDLRSIGFSPEASRSTEGARVAAWEAGIRELSDLFHTMKEEVLLFDASPGPAEPRPTSQPSVTVFVVHGRDEAMKQAVARTLEKLGLEPIILHDKPNLGRTIIEKFTDYSNVGFAVVLLSPDDIAYPRTEGRERERFRARQNVILELGYFLGKLGREAVLALHHADEDFEMPSDYSGVLFVPFDSTGRWQFDLVRELKACGYKVDANRLLE